MPNTNLIKLWERSLNPSHSKSSDNWEREIESLYNLGISMETTLQYLYYEKPDLEDFLLWIEQKKKTTTPSQSEEVQDVFTKEDLAFWEKNGFVIIREAIPEKDCIATQKAIQDFLGVKPGDKSTWYLQHEQKKGLMLNFSDHETLNKNRQSLKIRKAYEQLYKSKDIYKTIDKVSFSPPETSNFHFMGNGLHWDVSLKTPIPFALQGLLYLTDCGPDDGAFHCVPGFHNQLETWLEQLSADENPRDKALATLNPVPVAANAGDFIIWDNRLPHCATPNHGKLPRMVQYLTYLPKKYEAAKEWL